LLASAGYHVIVPYLRGYARPAFFPVNIPQWTAVGGRHRSHRLMDALKIQQAVLAGF